MKPSLARVTLHGITGTIHAAVTTSTGAWGMDFVSSPLFSNFHINHSFFKIFIIIRFFFI
jgi:hypothetical protein